MAYPGVKSNPSLGGTVVCNNTQVTCKFEIRLGDFYSCRIINRAVYTCPPKKKTVIKILNHARH